MPPRGWRRAPPLIGAFSLMLAAISYFGETPAGWLVALLGLALFVYGSAGFCLGCALTGCRVGPARGRG